MKILLQFKFKRSLIFFLYSLLLLTSFQVNATELYCGLAENTQIDPSIVTDMLGDAEKGYLYRVDTSTSKVTFEVNHFPFSTVEGRFFEFDGGVTLPEAMAPPKQALFVIKVDSIATGDDDLNNYLKSTVFFNTKQYPDIIFVSTGFEKINESTASLIGDLTLHGVTRTLVFNVHINKSENAKSNKNRKITLTTSTEIKRSDFGMSKMQTLVSDTVIFNLKIEASQVI